MSRCPAVAGTVALAAALAGALAPLRGQEGGPGTGGVIRIAQLRQALASPYRVLVIGAHPDDEDNDLMALLSRGAGVETAYLSLTRGEGGQNLIGLELGPALGVLRSGELDAARGVDGGHQFFTRAADFGFTTSLEESFSFWPRDSVLKDVVRVIRRFRPHVIVSVFSGTPRDGHGQHQVAGVLALDGFRAAGDTTRFRELLTEEQLAPWTPAKLYRDYGVSDGVVLDAGALDPVTGHTLRQVGRRARSAHRSQDMGGWEDPDTASVLLGLAATAAGVVSGSHDPLFAGITADADRFDAAHRDALRLAESGLILDAYLPDAEVVPGQRLPLTLVARNAGPARVRVRFDSLRSPVLRQVAAADSCRADTLMTLEPGAQWRCVVSVDVPPTAPIGAPYYLRHPPDGAMYRWSSDPSLRGLPFDPPPAVDVVVQLATGGSLSTQVPITARLLDQGIGELRRPVNVVPTLLVSLSPETVLWPASVGERSFTVSLEHAGTASITASVRLVAPPGWRVGPATTVALAREGERRSITFQVSSPRNVPAGEVQLRAEAIVGRDTFHTAVQRIEYSHVIPRVLASEAVSRVVVAPVAFAADRRIGYIQGAADRIPEALAAAGVRFRLLGAADLERGDLDDLDVVVVGPRAYEVDEGLRRDNPELLAFVERGGTLIVQYQQYQYVQGRYAPHPFRIARPHDRVTDETAPAHWLAGSERLQRTPNQLTAADFAGWVQERGLYFAASWDPAWTPLLAFTSPGAPPLAGGLLVSRLGRGTVVYTGLAFFRQLPAAVPGAWRIFANLLAMP